MRQASPFVRGVTLGLVIAVVVLFALSCGSSSEAPAEPTATPSQGATARNTPTPPGATPTPLHSQAETGLSCDNVVTQADIDALQANAKLTLPFPPCANMDKPSSVEAFDEGQIMYFYVPKGTPFVSPVTGQLIDNAIEGSQPLSGERVRLYIQGEDYGVYLIARHADFDPSLVGTTVQRGQIIGSVGDALAEQSETDGPTFGMDIGRATPPEHLLNISEPQHWAGGQPNFYLP